MRFSLCRPEDLGKGFHGPFVKSLSLLGFMRTGSEKMAGLGRRAGLDSWFSSFCRQKAQGVLTLRSQSSSFLSSYNLTHGKWFSSDNQTRFPAKVTFTAGPTGPVKSSVESGSYDWCLEKGHRFRVQTPPQTPLYLLDEVLCRLPIRVVSVSILIQETKLKK